jgi:tRNA pseudouridine13 synthase
VQSILDLLVRRGVPNYFGSQRFGMRGDTGEVGRALVRGDAETAMGLILGRTGPADYGQVRRARELYDRGEYEQAAKVWPYPFNNERRLCYALVKSAGNFEKALRSVDPQMKRFYVSAYQSHLFNQVVGRRLHGLDRLLPGDLAWRHPQGAVFRVEDVGREQPRCEAFEISPTGPLFGYRMTEPESEPGQIEQAVLAAENMRLEDWRQGTRLRVKGARRPLRFQPQQASVSAGEDDLGPYLELRFQLEPGCYATTVLREICKSGSMQTEGTHHGGTETRRRESGDELLN